MSALLRWRRTSPLTRPAEGDRSTRNNALMSASASRARSRSELIASKKYLRACAQQLTSVSGSSNNNRGGGGGSGSDAGGGSGQPGNTLENSGGGGGGAGRIRVNSLAGSGALSGATVTGTQRRRDHPRRTMRIEMRLTLDLEVRK